MPYKKPLTSKRITDLDCFADDTGLEVTALNGAPGVYSARYAGPERNSEANMNLLLSELKTKTDRSAQFKTVVALHYNGEIITFEGLCEGEITKEKKGTGGFGYDPIFKPLEDKLTFAELSIERKNQIGHRGKAVRKLVDLFKFCLNKITLYLPLEIPQGEDVLHEAWLKYVRYASK